MVRRSRTSTPEDVSASLPSPDWTSARRLFATGGLSVVLPVYNLAGAIGENLRALQATLTDKGFPFELIPVDDGSTDATWQALEPFTQRCRLAHNTGKGAAFLEGAAHARYDWVLLLDGDMDLSPERLPDFAAIALQSQADIVIGSKRHPESIVRYPLRRRLLSALYHAFTRACLRLPFSDTQCGMKLFRRDVLGRLAPKLLVKRFAFDLELLVVAQQQGIACVEAPVTVCSRPHQWGCITLRTLRYTLRDTLAITYRVRCLHYYATLTPLASPLPTEGPKFSVIVAFPGDSQVLRRLIDALREQTYRNFEVLFLPDLLMIRPEVNYRFRIIATGKVRPAKKRNQGALAATGDILAFIDDDAYPRPVWLANAAACFSAHAEITALGGPGLTPPEDPPWAQLSGMVFASPLVSGNFRYRYFIQGPLRKVEDYPSCNLFVRKAAFEEIRGFREDFWPGEDTLLCADLQRAGHTLWYDPRVVVYHHRRELFGPHLRQVGRYALHRGYFARCIGVNSRRLSYQIPSLFVLGVVIGAPLAFLTPWLAIPYLSVIGCYLFLTLVDALLEAPAWRWVVPFWAGVMATHLWYGVRFLQGIVSWKMPCGVKPFDHRA